jgi:hypothetical protein
MRTPESDLRKREAQTKDLTPTSLLMEGATKSGASRTATRNLDRSLVDAAMLELEKAHSVYIERRNTLAYFLSPSTARDRVGAPDSDIAKRTRSISQWNGSRRAEVN